MMIQTRLRLVKADIKNIGYLNKFTMGWYAGKMEGIMIGVVLSDTSPRIALPRRNRLIQY